MRISNCGAPATVRDVALVMRDSFGTLPRSDSSRLVAILALVVILTPWSAIRSSASPIADFDDGTLQGWTKTSPFGGNLFVDTTGGNPGGFMVSTDTATGGGGLYSLAPQSFTGDLSSYLRVQWDEFVYNHGSHTIGASAIGLRGGPNDTTYLYIPPLEVVGSWHTRTALFTSSDWQQINIFGANGADTLAAVLEDVTAFYIGMDASNIGNGNREVGIDNVTLVAVPEPSSLGLLALGAVLLAFMYRRARSTR